MGGQIPRESVTREDLESYFSSYGHVVNVYVPAPKPDKRTQIAFVTMHDRSCLDEIFDQEHVVEGSALHIVEADDHNKGRRDDATEVSWGGVRRSHQPHRAAPY